MEQDLDTAAKAVLVGKRIDSMLEIVKSAKKMRKVLTYLPEENRSVIEAVRNVPGIDEMSIIMGFASVSDGFLEDFETTLNEIAEMASIQAGEVIDIRHLSLVESFIAAISELKPRSIRHLENFFSAATDGEWVDGMFLARGKDSEFRCIDRCSEVAREEFGLGQNKK